MVLAHARFHADPCHVHQHAVCGNAFLCMIMPHGMHAPKAQLGKASAGLIWAHYIHCAACVSICMYTTPCSALRMCLPCTMPPVLGGWRHALHGVGLAPMGLAWG